MECLARKPFRWLTIGCLVPGVSGCGESTESLEHPLLDRSTVKNAASPESLPQEPPVEDGVIHLETYRLGRLLELLGAAAGDGDADTARYISKVFDQAREVATRILADQLAAYDPEDPDDEGFDVYFENTVARVRDSASAVRAANERVELTQQVVGTSTELAKGERRRFEVGSSNLIFVNLREQQAAMARVQLIDAVAVAEIERVRWETTTGAECR